MPSWRRQTRKQEVKDLPNAEGSRSVGDTFDFVVPIAPVPPIPLSNAIYEGAGRWVEIQRQTASTSATLDFTSQIDGRFSKIRFHLVGLRPATDDRELWVRVMVAGVVQSGASDYSWVSRYDDTAGGGSPADGADSEIAIGGTAAGDAFGNATTESGSGIIELTSHTSTALYKNIRFDVSFLNAGGESTRISGTGTFRSTSAVDGVRFLFETGDIAEGTIIAEGLVNA